MLPLHATPTPTTAYVQYQTIPVVNQYLHHLTSPIVRQLIFVNKQRAFNCNIVENTIDSLVEYSNLGLHE
jgi:hypothetical protein